MKKIFALLAGILACLSVMFLAACGETVKEVQGEIFDEGDYGTFVVSYSATEDVSTDEINLYNSIEMNSKNEFDEYAVENEVNEINFYIHFGIKITDAENYEAKINKIVELYGIDCNSVNYAVDKSNYDSEALVMPVDYEMITIKFNSYDNYREYGDTILSKLENGNLKGYAKVHIGPIYCNA